MQTTIYNRAVFGIACGLIVFATVAYGAVHQAVLALVYLSLALLVALWALDCHRRGELLFSRSHIQVPILAAAAYGFLQVVPYGSFDIDGVAGIARTVSIEPFSTTVAAAHLLALGVFFSLVLTTADTAKRLRIFVIFISIFGFAYAFFAILQAVLSPDKIYGIYGRPGMSVFGSFVNRNHFAAWMEMAIAIPLGMLFSGSVSKDKRLLFVTAAVLMGTSILVSGSRGGLVAFLIEVIFLSMITFGTGERRLGLRISLALGLVVAVVVGTVFIGGETSLSRLSESQVTPGLAQDRSHIWSVSLDIIRNSMPLGVGLGAFGTAYPKFDDSSGLERVEQAHNDYLQVLTDAGLPGAVIGILFLFLIYRAGRRISRTENRFRRSIGAGAVAGILGVLVHSAFDFVLHTTAVALLFLAMLAIAEVCGHPFPDDVPNEGTARRRRGRSAGYGDAEL